MYRGTAGLGVDTAGSGLSRARENLLFECCFGRANDVDDSDS